MTHHGLPIVIEQLDWSAVPFVGVLHVQGTETRIIIHNNYPFEGPKLRGVAPLITCTNWLWVALVLRRSTNRAYMPHSKACACCTSPLCHWNVRHNIQDLAAYAHCRQDMHECSEVLMERVLGRLPADAVYVVVEMAWS